jgi:hypothetical protein
VGWPGPDQRAKGELYVHGVMLDGKRKPMAGRLGVDHQQQQQFVTSSTWDCADVRRRPAWWAEEFIAPQAYVADDTRFAKDGSDSPGVARMYCGALGKTGNCQIGVCMRLPAGRPRRRAIEGALEGELDDHLGHGKRDPAGRDGGDSRNGHCAKTVLTETGPGDFGAART